MRAPSVPTDAVVIQELAGMATNVYRVIADTQINLDFDGAREAWRAEKAATTADIERAAGLVDTPEERAKLKALREAFDRIVSLYEGEMVPRLVAAQATTAETKQLDGEIDVAVTRMAAEAEAIVASLAAESAEADKAFDASARATVTRGLIVAVLGIAGLLAIVWFVVRNISRSLREMTDDAAPWRAGGGPGVGSGVDRVPVAVAGRDRAGGVARRDVGVDGRNGVDDAQERRELRRRPPGSCRRPKPRSRTRTRRWPTWSRR